MDVKAVFELPVHIWATSDALDTSFPAGFGDLRFTVVMPKDEGPVDAALAGSRRNLRPAARPKLPELRRRPQPQRGHRASARTCGR